MSAKLPPSMKPLFWETNFSKLDPRKYRFYVVERLLQWGRPPHIRWMLRRYPKRFILKVNNESREIRPDRRYFWNFYLGKTTPIKRRLQTHAH